MGTAVVVAAVVVQVWDPVRMRLQSLSSHVGDSYHPELKVRDAICPKTFLPTMDISSMMM